MTEARSIARHVHVPSRMAWDHGGNPFFDSLRGDSAAEITAYWDKPCGVYGPLGEPELIVGEALKRETIRVTPQ